MSDETEYSRQSNKNTLQRGSYNDYGDGTPAKQVLAKITGQDGPIQVEIVGDSGNKMTCEKGVFNLIAGIPLEILANRIDEICDANFFKDDGKKVFIGYKNLVNKIVVCSSKTMVNLEYRIEGLETSC